MGSAAITSLLSSQSLFAAVIESNLIEYDSKSIESECVESVDSNKNRARYIKQSYLLYKSLVIQVMLYLQK